MWFRTTWREVSAGHRKRFYLLLCVAAVSITDLVVSLILQIPSYLSNMFRPVVFMIFSVQARSNLYFIILLLKDSSVVILSTFVYVAFFGFTGFYIFKTTMEGFIYFRTPSMGLYNMFICLTTANFPDVMLPAYNENRFYCLFFIGYLMFGLYFLQNLILAMIFDNYKKRV